MKNGNENSRGVNGDMPLTLNAIQGGVMNEVEELQKLSIQLYSSLFLSTSVNLHHNPRQSSKIIKSQRFAQWKIHFVWRREKFSFIFFALAYKSFEH